MAGSPLNLICHPGHENLPITKKRRGHSPHANCGQQSANSTAWNQAHVRTTERSFVTECGNRRPRQAGDRDAERLRDRGTLRVSNASDHGDCCDIGQVTIAELAHDVSVRRTSPAQLPATVPQSRVQWMDRRQASEHAHSRPDLDRNHRSQSCRLGMRCWFWSWLPRVLT